MADTTTTDTTTTTTCAEATVLNTLWQTAVIGAVIYGAYYWATGEGITKGHWGSRAAKYAAGRISSHFR